MSRSDRIALLLSLIAVVVTYFVADRIFERMAHLEDEMAYVWQAQAIARDQMTVPTPESPKSFLVPFVVDYEGRRFGKYPLGWPAALSLGIRLGARSLVNPLLAGLGVWLTYRLGKKTKGETVGLLAAGLTLISPFFLMNSGSLLSHPFALVLSAAFAMAWLDTFPDRSSRTSWLPLLVASFCLGVLVLTRPLTAVGVAIPFAVHGLYLLVRGNAQVRWRLVTFSLIVLTLSSLHFLWQYAVTGDPFFNPYTLWWKYDRIGFAPGVGRIEGGHTPYQAYINTRFSLTLGVYDFFGWGPLTWGLLALGLLVTLRKPRALMLAGVFPSLVAVYLLYWIGSWLFGPRYYYEGLYSLALLAAAGIAWLAGWPTSPGEAYQDRTGWRRARPLAVTALLALMIFTTVYYYDPIRLDGMQGLYGISRSALAPFTGSAAADFTPALVIVHPAHKWTEYGALLELEDPFLDTPFIFVHSRGKYADGEVSAEFRDRKIYHYYPAEEPYTLYLHPRPEAAQSGE